MDISATNVQSILIRHSVPLDRWGKGATKPFELLMRELEDGEAVLIETYGGKLYRLIGVVRVRVECKRGKLLRYLVEVEQRFANGSVRQRGIPHVAGKILFTESPEAAALRELKEEIGLVEAEVIRLRKFQTDEKSMSFPGLHTLYVNYEFLCSVPADFYQPEGYSSVSNGTETTFRWAEEKDEHEPSDP